MNAQTCAALAAVYPIVLLTLALDRGRIRTRLRTAHGFRRFSEWSISLALIGLVISVVGIATDGLGLAASIVAWGVFGAVMLGFSVHILAIVASAQVDDEEAESRG